MALEETLEGLGLESTLRKDIARVPQPAWTDKMGSFLPETWFYLLWGQLRFADIWNSGFRQFMCKILGVPGLRYCRHRGAAGTLHWAPRAGRLERAAGGKAQLGEREKLTPRLHLGHFPTAHLHQLLSVAHNRAFNHNTTNRAQVQSQCDFTQGDLKSFTRFTAPLSRRMGGEWHQAFFFFFNMVYVIFLSRFLKDICHVHSVL